VDETRYSLYTTDPTWTKAVYHLNNWGCVRQATMRH